MYLKLLVIRFDWAQSNFLCDAKATKAEKYDYNQQMCDQHDIGVGNYMLNTYMCI